MGKAFQIQDDIISLTSEEYIKERGVGEDIREGKRSLMVVKLINQKSNRKAKKLREILDMHTNDEKLLNKAVQIITSSKAID